MDQFLNSLPKSILAGGAILLGFFFIVYSNPPRTVCDAQMEIFREAQHSFLYPTKEGLLTRPAQVKDLYQRCFDENNPGSCFDYFQRLKKMNLDLDNIPRQCAAAASEENEIRENLWKALTTMVQLAWGAKPPRSYIEKHGWFDASDVALYCELKKQTIRIFGEESYGVWLKQTMAILPGEDKMPFEAAWAKTILSTSCDAFR